MKTSTQASSEMKIDNKNSTLYTPEQVETIALQAVKLAFQQVPTEHLESSIPQFPPAMTVAEAAQMIGISKPTMYELIRSKKIHSVNVGKKILVSRQSLLDWVEGRNE